MRRIKFCFVALSFTLSICLEGSQALGTDSLFPRPSKDDLAKTEEKIRELYKLDLEQAAKPKDKITLAASLLTAAEGVGQDDASRLVMWSMARDLAAQANDGALSMKAVKNIITRFQPDGTTDPKKQIELGNVSWREADAAPADKRLCLRINAAEWYLRAKPVVTGLDEVLVEKRLNDILAEKPAGEVTIKPSLTKRTYNVSLVSARGHKHVFTVDAVNFEDAKAQVASGYPTAHSIVIQEK